MFKPSEAEKELVAATLSTKGWEIIEQMFCSEIMGLKLPDEVNPDKRWEDVAVETIGKGYAVRKLKRLLANITGCAKKQLTNGPETWA